MLGIYNDFQIAKRAVYYTGTVSYIGRCDLPKEGVNTPSYVFHLAC
jgi:hypothetical protein